MHGGRQLRGSTSLAQKRYSKCSLVFLSFGSRKRGKRRLNEVIYWYVAANNIGSGVNVNYALLLYTVSIRMFGMDLLRVGSPSGVQRCLSTARITGG